MSVLDYQDLSACAKKIRKPGYWKIVTEFVDGVPGVVIKWISDQSSTDCKYDRRHSDPACAAAKCERIA